MSENNRNEQTGLLYSGHQGLTKQSENLVRRGLNYLSRHNSRTVSFPTCWSMGSLCIVSPDGDCWWENDWEEFGEAKGVVVVPPDKKFVLRVEEREVTEFAYIGEISWVDYRRERFTDLSPLAVLNCNDLQGLDLSKTWLNCSPEETTWANLAYIENFTGLEWLNLRGTNLDDRSLVHLESLANLKWLDLRENLLTGFGISHLSKLKDLQVLQLSFTENLGSRLFPHLFTCREDSWIEKEENLLPKGCKVIWD